MYKTIQFCSALFLSLTMCLSATSILDHINSSCTHQFSGIEKIDAAFLIRLQENEGLQKLREELRNNKTYVSEYNIFNRLSNRILTSYCSTIVSPYLLTEILSHLSIYQYCLDHNIQNALILENHAYLVDNPEKLSSIISTLEEIDPAWDILYTDVDYHHATTGEFIVPNLHYLPSNKSKIDSAISKIHCRYGTAAFVISSSGMRKVLDYFLNNWDDLPLDQTLFKIPSLQIYGVTSDIITNRYLSAEERKNATEEDKFKPPLLETGREFWIDPLKLLTYDRFDAMAKYIYAKYSLKNYQTSWHRELYKSHLEKWIHFYNTEPLKIGYLDFQQSFDLLIENLATNMFNPVYPIPINTLCLACNGSHRIGICLALKIPVKVVVQEGEDSPLMTADAFREMYHLKEKYLDHMAFEYANLKKNTRIVSLFPIGYILRDQAKKILSKYGIIVHYKDLWLSDSGCLEYIRLAYNGEWWTGSYLDNFKHSRAKAELCFPKSLRLVNPVRVYLYECDSEFESRKAKEEIRALCNYGNESIHINDTHAQTKIIAATVFNENSIQFINTKRPNIYPHFDENLEKLKTFIEINNLDSELLCVDTGAVLGAYGLRECQDIDIIHKIELPKTYGSYEIDSHNSHLHHHTKSLDELLFNPNYHFYYQGIKFVSLNLVREMKLNRYSDKDLKDIQLIDDL
jgi:GR25 family glycosyltransferase involved in LPS biosynthesis